MFVIPAGMMLGANVSIAQWWGWNQAPVLVGNLIGALVLTVGLFYFSHRTMVRRPAARVEGVHAATETQAAA